MMRRILEICLQAFQYRFRFMSIHLNNRSLFVTRFDVVNALHLYMRNGRTCGFDSFHPYSGGVGFRIHRPLMLRQNV